MKKKLIETNFKSFKNKENIIQKTISFVNKPHSRISYISLSSAYIYPKLWNVITNDFVILKGFERVYSDIKYQKFIFEFNNNKLPVKFTDLQEGSFFLLGGENNYWHFLADYLPRLACISNIKENIKIIIPLNLPEKYILFLEQIINELNMQNISFYKINENYIFQFEKLIIAQRPNIYFSFIFYDSLIGKYFPKKPLNNLFIIRGNVLRRNAINEIEVSEYLKKYNYKAINCAKLTIHEQINAFSQAKNVIIISGASLINLLFVPDGIKVIEIRSNNDGRFSLLVQMKKRFELFFLNTSEKVGNEFRKDIIIDYENLERTLLKEKMF